MSVASVENKINWSALLDNSTKVANLIADWATEELSTREVSRQLTFTSYAGHFRHLVRSHGTQKGRVLARKALRRRGIEV